MTSFEPTSPLTPQHHQCLQADSTPGNPSQCQPPAQCTLLHELVFIVHKGPSLPVALLYGGIPPPQMSPVFAWPGMAPQVGFLSELFGTQHTLISEPHYPSFPRYPWHPQSTTPSADLCSKSQGQGFGSGWEP
mmetsp:Transcript_130707/g.226125  ORF Transcript_130707/g.226125 Transcript_130707/m.226125 type:complete len:133 (-) Transcript_130707:59-457(-)